MSAVSRCAGNCAVCFPGKVVGPKHAIGRWAAGKLARLRRREGKGIAGGMRSRAMAAWAGDGGLSRIEERNGERGENNWGSYGVSLWASHGSQQTLVHGGPHMDMTIRDGPRNAAAASTGARSLAPSIVLAAGRKAQYATPPPQLQTPYR